MSRDYVSPSPQPQLPPQSSGGPTGVPPYLRQIYGGTAGQGGSGPGNNNKIPGFPTKSADLQIYNGYRSGGGGSGEQYQSLKDFWDQFYAMSDAQVQALAQKLVQAGLLPSINQDRTTIWQAWSAIINEAGNMSNAPGGIKVTPMQRLAAYMKNPLDSGGGKQPLKAYSTTNKAAVNFTDPAQARQMLTQSLTDSLGRAPTPAEQQAYMAALHAAEAAHPTITKTNYTPNSTGTAYDTTSTNLSQQIDPNAYTSDYAKGHNQVEHASYQASTTYMNALMGALGATA